MNASQERAEYHGHITHTCLIELARVELRTRVAAGDHDGATRTRARIKVLEASRSVRASVQRSYRR